MLTGRLGGEGAFLRLDVKAAMAACASLQQRCCVELLLIPCVLTQSGCGIARGFYISVRRTHKVERRRLLLLVWLLLDNKCLEW